MKNNLYRLTLTDDKHGDLSRAANLQQWVGNDTIHLVTKVLEGKVFMKLAENQSGLRYATFQTANQLIAGEVEKKDGNFWLTASHIIRIDRGQTAIFMLSTRLNQYSFKAYIFNSRISADEIAFNGGRIWVRSWQDDSGGFVRRVDIYHHNGSKIERTSHLPSKI